MPAPLVKVAQWLGRVLTNELYSKGDKAAAAALFHCHNRLNGRLDPGAGHIGRLASLSRRGAQEAIDHLVAGGDLRKINRGRKRDGDQNSNAYQLIFPGEMASAATAPGGATTEPGASAGTAPEPAKRFEPEKGTSPSYAPRDRPRAQRELCFLDEAPFEISDSDLLAAFADFWSRYPGDGGDRKVGQHQCWRRYRRIVRNRRATIDQLREGADLYARTVDPQFILKPKNWLDQEGWKAGPPPHHRQGAAAAPREGYAEAVVRNAAARGRDPTGGRT
jgi:hypothetical protein